MLRGTRWLLAAVAVAIQFFALYRPSGPPSSLSIPGLDKVAHLLIFALPVLLILLALSSSVRSLSPSVRSLSLSKGMIIIGIFAAHAVISEVVQGTFYRHRNGDPWDVVADVLGIALGGLVFVLVARRRSGRVDGNVPDRVVAP